MNSIPSSELRRTLIFGNGGSGKTWLARKLGDLLQHAPIHLDDLRWEPGNYGIPRNNQLVANEVAEAGKADSWLMEGVYGWLANVVLHRATTLIWIDLPENECIANVKERGIQGGGSEEAFQELLKWIAEYRLRNNSSCFAAHSQLFEAFVGPKFLLKSRHEIGTFLDNVSQNS